MFLKDKNNFSVSKADTLITARTINGTSFNGSANITTSNWGTARTLTIGNTGKSVNGSGNVSWSLSEIGAAASSHTHSYLPLSGGTLTGDLTCNKYLKINAWSGYGSGTCNMWFNASSSSLHIDNINNIHINGKDIAFNGHVHHKIEFQDTRSVNHSPGGYETGITAHLKLNSTDGLGDGGTYHPVLTWKCWSEHSGGPYGQLAVSQNNNLFYRASTNDSTWNRWKKVLCKEDPAIIEKNMSLDNNKAICHTSQIAIKADNNGMGIGLDGVHNSRTGWIQVGHGDDNYAGSNGTLRLNPRGGNVEIGHPWIKLGGYWLTISPSAPSASTGDIWIQN